MEPIPPPFINLANLIHLQTNHLAGRITSHGYPLDHVSDLNRVAVVGKANKLGVLAELSQQVADATHIRQIYVSLGI